jgi:hypothetical protein
VSAMAGDTRIHARIEQKTERGSKTDSTHCFQPSPLLHCSLLTSFPASPWITSINVEPLALLVRPALPPTCSIEFCTGAGRNNQMIYELYFQPGEIDV